LTKEQVEKVRIISGNAGHNGVYWHRYYNIDYGTLYLSVIYVSTFFHTGLLIILVISFQKTRSRQNNIRFLEPEPNGTVICSKTLTTETLHKYENVLLFYLYCNI
jgi:hypothetical protein